MELRSKPGDPIRGRKLEVKDIRITGVEMSGDGENWQDPKNMDSWGAVGSGLAHIVDLIANGERVFLRCKYVDVYSNGSNGLPKTGAIYEIQLIEVEPLRRLIEASATTDAGRMLEAGIHKAAATEEKVNEILNPQK